MLTYSEAERGGNGMNKNESLERQLTALDGMSVAELKARFLELYGFVCGATNANGLRNRIAYKLQEINFGGLSDRDKKLLEKLAGKDPLAGSRSAKSRPLAKGTRLCREWRGNTYEVVVRGDGLFEFNGEIHRSLTSVASAITGTHWNGKKFFGVK